MAAANKVVPAVIVGGGRVGFALEKLGDGEDVVREQPSSFPLYA